jgi:hypothetical protein
MFASFYIPYLPKEENAYAVGQFIAQQHRGYIEEFNGRFHMASPRPGEMSSASNDRIKFNGRVFLYYDNFISDDHIAEIRLAFTKLHSDVVFRGPNYLAYLQARGVAPK